jgi:DNA-directed RNA polymerase subunit RPC12/RpoP
MPHAPSNYEHKEAFCLMWYFCSNCSTRLHFWNSRDGVTPFSTQCPSCGAMDLCHTEFHHDSFTPNHQPWHGQPIWVDMTVEQAEFYVALRIKQSLELFREEPSTKVRQALFDDIYKDGKAPDLIYHGYLRDPNAARRAAWWSDRKRDRI